MSQNPPDQTSPELWAAVDAYMSAALPDSDPALAAVQAANAAAGLPSIDVAPNQGKLLHILARLIGARRILEIGTLGGYSAIWLARALPPGGKLVSLEFQPRHAEIAQQNLETAGVGDLVEIRVGPALETLPKLEGHEAFDFVFIDADKESNAAYLDWAIRLTRPGGLVVCDNVVRRGGVIDPDHPNTATQGTRRFFEALAKEKRLTATGLQTVGVKGWDGLVIGIVEA
ncbi:O-methyltransferase [Neomegalonema perideroedes]|uniref:O-methyltransferase n=1 Tax=Neomegalonema perideroedes TaxID=217219 RepID=UPI00037445ED|nr:O-methyltransferase [Neomegalonema perideroedes]